MRTQEITIYSFNELSDESKQRARERYRANNYETMWADEILDSLKTLFEVCSGITLKNYDLGYRGSGLKIEFSQEEAGALSGKRAIAWLENNLLSTLRVPYRGPQRTKLRQYGADYYAGKIKPCPLTGVCYDEDYLSALRNDVNNGNTLIDSFRWLGNKYNELIEAEESYQNSDEYIDECLADSEFTSDGGLYR